MSFSSVLRAGQEQGSAQIMENPPFTPALKAVRQKSAGLSCAVEEQREFAPNPGGVTSLLGRGSSSRMLEPPPVRGEGAHPLWLQHLIPGLNGVASEDSWVEWSGMGAFLTPQALSAALQACSFCSAKGFVARILCCAKATFCCQGDGVTEIEGLYVCKTLQCLKWK